MIFRFAHPWFLLLLLTVPLWVWCRSSRRFRFKLNFPSGAGLKNLPVSLMQRLHPVLTFLNTLGLVLLTLALARPQSGIRKENVSTETVDIVLVIDTSTSMRAVDLGETREENRLDVVKNVAEMFIESRPADRISLIAFAALPYTKSPLTLDHEWLLEHRLKDLRTGDLPDGTAIGTALVSAVNRLRQTESKSRIIVLLTDGINTSGDIEPLEAATLAKTQGIKVYTIGAGSDGPVERPVQGPFGRTMYMKENLPIDTETLEKIAEETGGRFFRARDKSELEEVFKEIDELERTEIDLTEYTLYSELYLWFAFSGFGLLLSERILSAGRLGRALS